MDKSKNSKTVPESLVASVICCANCGDTPDFSPLDNILWFCTQECYEEYYETNDVDYFPTGDDLQVS